MFRVPGKAPGGFKNNIITTSKDILEQFIPYLQIIAGLVLLTAGGEFIVRGAVGLALLMGVSKVIVGLTIVAAGTSAPEFVVSLNAALKDTADIAMGNVVGSNIANILLILGAVAVLKPISASRMTVVRDGGSSGFSPRSDHAWHAKVPISRL